MNLLFQNPGESTNKRKAGSNIEHFFAFFSICLNKNCLEIGRQVFDEQNKKPIDLILVKNNKRVVIPIHEGRDVPKGTLLNIIKQAGLTKIDVAAAIIVKEGKILITVNRLPMEI